MWKYGWTGEHSHHNAATIYMTLVSTSQGARCGDDMLWQLWQWSFADQAIGFTRSRLLTVEGWRKSVDVLCLHCLKPKKGQQDKQAFEVSWSDKSLGNSRLAVEGIMTPCTHEFPSPALRLTASFQRQSFSVCIMLIHVVSCCIILYQGAGFQDVSRANPTSSSLADGAQLCWSSVLDTHHTMQCCTKDTIN